MDMGSCCAAIKGRRDKISGQCPHLPRLMTDMRGIHLLVLKSITMSLPLR